MSIESLYVQRLKEKTGEISIEMLERPSDPSQFGYGKACGLITGLRLAEQLFLELLRDERNDKN